MIREKKVSLTLFYRSATDGLCFFLRKGMSGMFLPTFAPTAQKVPQSREGHDHSDRMLIRSSLDLFFDEERTVADILDGPQADLHVFLIDKRTEAGVLTHHYAVIMDQSEIPDTVFGRLQSPVCPFTQFPQRSFEGDEQVSVDGVFREILRLSFEKLKSQRTLEAA